jgi:heme-degrading monooxygenase HmoA
MVGIVWEFIVRDEAVAEFQHAYGPEGEWVALFRQYPGYAGTSLLKDTVVPGRFLTVDRWETEAHYEDMLASTREDYARLDRRFSAFTVSERKLGAWSED